MSKTRTAKKRYGLRLTLPGAPNTPHVVGDLPGHYRPDVPTPVGGPGEVSVEAARQLAEPAGVPLELVEIKTGEVAEAEELAQRTEQDVRKGIVAQRKAGPKGAEVRQLADEQKALKKESK